jgi:hypothetical protein
MNRKPETDQDLIDALVKFFQHDESEWTSEEIDQELQAAGLDPATVGANLASLAEQAYRSSPLHWKRRARGERLAALERLAEHSAKRIPKSRAETMLAIRELTSRSPELQAHAHFRNFEHASDEDLIDLLDNLRFLAESGPEGE